MKILLIGKNGQIGSKLPTELESSEFPTAVKRPRYFALDCTKLEDRFGIRLPDWQYDLSLALTARNLPEAQRAALAAVA